MSSPKSHKDLADENSNDFKNISVFLKSVDDRKPLGKLVKIYANQKFWDGYWTGLCVGFALGAAFSIAIRRVRG